MRATNGLGASLDGIYRTHRIWHLAPHLRCDTSGSFAHGGVVAIFQRCGKGFPRHSMCLEKIVYNRYKRFETSARMQKRMLW